MGGSLFRYPPFAGRAVASRKRGPSAERGARKMQPQSNNLRGWNQPFPPRGNGDLHLLWATRIPCKSTPGSSLPLDAC